MYTQQTQWCNSFMKGLQTYKNNIKKLYNVKMKLPR